MGAILQQMPILHTQLKDIPTRTGYRIDNLPKEVQDELLNVVETAALAYDWNSIDPTNSNADGNEWESFNECLGAYVGGFLDSIK